MFGMLAACASALASALASYAFAGNLPEVDDSALAIFSAKGCALAVTLLDCEDSATACSQWEEGYACCCCSASASSALAGDLPDVDDSAMAIFPAKGSALAGALPDDDDDDDDDDGSAVACSQ